MKKILGLLSVLSMAAVPSSQITAMSLNEVQDSIDLSTYDIIGGKSI